MQTLRFNNANGANDTDIYVKIDRIAAIDKNSTGDVTVMEITDGLNHMLPIGAQDQADGSNYAIVGQLQALPKTIGSLKTFANNNSLDLYFLPTVVGNSPLRIAGILAKPATLTFGTTTTTSIVVNWTSGDADGTIYILQRATNAGFTTGLTTIYTGTALTKTDTGLTTGTTYYYRIVATAPGFGNSDYRTGSHATS